MTDINNSATVAAPTRAEKFAARIDLLTKRIAADTEALAAVRLEAETAEKLASVVAGTAIIAKVGRAETLRQVNARVVGVKDEDNGSRRYKIAFGEGMDTEVLVIQPSQIVEIIVESGVPVAE